MEAPPKTRVHRTFWPKLRGRSTREQRNRPNQFCFCSEPHSVGTTSPAKHPQAQTLSQNLHFGCGVVIQPRNLPLGNSESGQGVRAWGLDNVVKRASYCRWRKCCATPCNAVYPRNYTSITLRPLAGKTAATVTFSHRIDWCGQCWA